MEQPGWSATKSRKCAICCHLLPSGASDGEPIYQACGPGRRIDPALAMPVMLGVLSGSVLGARHLFGAKTRVLRLAFAIVVAVLAAEMLYSGLTGKI